MRDNAVDLGPKVKTREASLKEEFEAFNKLPFPVRRFIDEQALYRYSAINVLEATANLKMPPDDVVKAMRAEESQIESELRIVK